MRVAFLTNIVSPYRAPVFDELARTPGWEFRLFVNAENEFDRDWRNVRSAAPVTPIKTLSIRRTVRTERPVPCTQRIALHIPLTLGRELTQFAPDVVISLELGPRTVLAALWCRRHGIPLVVWSYQSRAATSMRGLLRRAARRFVLRRCQAAVGMGIQAREALRQSGVPGERIFDAPNAADFHAIERRIRAADRPARVADLRARVDGDRVLLVVGRLVPMKAAPTIVKIWRRLPATTRAGWRLVFVGDGPLASHVRGLEAEGIEHVGQVPPEVVTDWLLASDLHMFASLVDVWGLVVNEAMQCGTPSLCSIHAGCADDLIGHGENGWLFDPTDEHEWTRQLGELLQRSDLHEVGERARLAASRLRPEYMAEGFRDAVAHTIRPAMTRRLRA